MGNHIYTIGRELGSGGYTVAKLLAERLGIRLYLSLIHISEPTRRS